MTCIASMGYAGIGSFVFSPEGEYFLRGNSETTTGTHTEGSKNYDIVELEGVDSYGTELSNTGE